MNARCEAREMKRDEEPTGTMSDLGCVCIGGDASERPTMKEMYICENEKNAKKTAAGADKFLLPQVADTSENSSPIFTGLLHQDI